VPPNYWLLDTSAVGGAFGFLTEGGPGESPLTHESFAKTIPNAHQWPVDNYWNYHCGASFGNFGTLTRFTTPLDTRYGAAKGTADYLQKSQLAAYEGLRAMFEGYSRNKYTSTGVIQWMLNNAWPEMIWHMYDYYLNQGGGYFGSKKACEPVHIMYSYNDASVWVVNSHYTPVSNLRASAEAFNLDGSSLYNHSAQVPSIAADGVQQLFVIPAITANSKTYFVRVRLYDSDNNPITDNVYWLSTSPDVPNFSRSTWYNTPCTSYADFTALQTLPAVSLNVTFKTATQSGVVTITVDVRNPSTSVAFFIRLRVTKGSGGDDVLPIFWDDNYFTLKGHEERVVQATFSAADIGAAQPVVVTELWNNISGKM